MQTVVVKDRSPSSLRVMQGLLWIAFAMLAVFTIVTVVVTITKGGLGGGNLYVQGWTEEVVIEHTSPSGTFERQDLMDRAARVKADADADTRFLHARVLTTVAGAGPRAVLIVGALANLALGWFAFLNLRGLTNSSQQGQVFTRDNARRIARLGWTAMAFPVVVQFIGRSVFNSVVTNEQVGVSGFWVDDGIDNQLIWIGVGVFLLTISRMFLLGVELQELEEGTI